jgi:hypothetical protein
VADVLPDMGCACDPRNRRWSVDARRCATCRCAYRACGISASPQGVQCARAIGHRGSHLTNDGLEIKVRRR